MGVRRLEALVNGLPPNSALMRDMDEHTRAGWGHTEELLAGVIEMLDVHNRYYLAAHGVKKLPKPVKIIRPVESDNRQKAQKRQATLEDIQGMRSNMPVITVGKEGE